jgi:hypothetical protein
MTAKVLKACAEEPVMSHIFQLSLTTGELPSDWRNANMTPIFKKGDKHTASNYGPLALFMFRLVNNCTTPCTCTSMFISLMLGYFGSLTSGSGSCAFSFVKTDFNSYSAVLPLIYCLGEVFHFSLFQLIDLCPRIIQSKTSVEEKWTELKNEINNTLGLNVPKELISNRHNLPWPSSSADYIVYCLHNSSELVLQPFALHAFEACIYPSFMFFLSSELFGITGVSFESFSIFP